MTASVSYQRLQEIDSQINEVICTVDLLHRLGHLFAEGGTDRFDCSHAGFVVLDYTTLICSKLSTLQDLVQSLLPEEPPHEAH